MTILTSARGYSYLASEPITAQRFVVGAALLALALGFVAVFMLGIWREAPLSNSYAALAQGWLDGRLDTDVCFDDDCALFEGRTYIIFPPMPAVVALPFVALFGVGFAGFLPLSVLAFAASGWLWWRIAAQETASRDITILLVALVLFATPLGFVTLRGDNVWFFAQSLGFLFATAAIHSALVSRNALMAGLFIGAAFLCRQMTILYLPLLYIVLLDRDTPLFRIDWAAIRRAVTLAAFPVAALLIYFACNYVRFGSPMETGYSYIFPPIWDVPGEGGMFLRDRVRELGLFSEQYLLFNAIYMFLAGPHVEFTGRYMTEMAGFDINGASPFLVAPALLFAFLAPWDRRFWWGFGTVALVLALTLLYHSNGFSQYSAQRYALDWLPVLLVFVARGVKPQHAGPLSLLVVYSMAVTLGMIALGGILAA
jgi:hypothetical protein